MKQLPFVSSLLYGTPWAILPASHAELGSLYRAYLAGNLPAAPAAAAPRAALPGTRYYSSGISLETGNGIAIISASGVIVKRAPEMLCGPSLVDLAILDAVIDEVAADDMIQTVVLFLDSPGGSVTGLQESGERIRELAQDKRVVAYSDGVCCSAAYWLACACDEVYFAPSAVTGSIGSYIAGLDDSREWEMEGLELVLAKSGNLKAVGHPGARFREWVRARRGDVPQEAMEGQWYEARDAAPRIHDGLYRDLPALLAELVL
jgi:ClpP class serine protease